MEGEGGRNGDCRERGNQRRRPRFATNNLWLKLFRSPSPPADTPWPTTSAVTRGPRFQSRTADVLVLVLLVFRTGEGGHSRGALSLSLLFFCEYWWTTLVKKSRYDKPGKLLRIRYFLLSFESSERGEKRNAIKPADVRIQISVKEFTSAQSVSRGKIRSEINFTFQTRIHTYCIFVFPNQLFPGRIYIICIPRAEDDKAFGKECFLSLTRSLVRRERESRPISSREEIMARDTRRT